MDPVFELSINGLQRYERHYAAFLNGVMEGHINEKNIDSELVKFASMVGRKWFLVNEDPRRDVELIKNLITFVQERPRRSKYPSNSTYEMFRPKMLEIILRFQPKIKRTQRGFGLNCSPLAGLIVYSYWRLWERNPKKTVVCKNNTCGRETLLLRNTKIYCSAKCRDNDWRKSPLVKKVRRRNQKKREIQKQQ